LLIPNKDNAIAISAILAFILTPPFLVVYFYYTPRKGGLDDLIINKINWLQQIGDALPFSGA